MASRSTIRAFEDAIREDEQLRHAISNVADIDSLPEVGRKLRALAIRRHYLVGQIARIKTDMRAGL